MAEENAAVVDPNAPKGEDPNAKVKADPREKRAIHHFKEHVAAIRDAANNVSRVNAKLKTAAPNDKHDLHNELDTHVAQLTLAVNNAHDAPDEDVVENTGGAARTDAVDPNPNVD